MMDSSLKKRLKTQGKDLNPLVRIGKNGITDSAVLEVKKVLKKYKLVKVKLLKAAFDKGSKKEVGKELADRTGSVIIEQIGFVVVLYRR